MYPERHVGQFQEVQRHGVLVICFDHSAEMLFPTFAVLLLQVSLVVGWNTFVVSHTDGQDDIPGLVSAIGDHSINSTILFRKGVHYNIFTPIKFPALNNVEVRIEGNLSYPTDIPAIQGNFR